MQKKYILTLSCKDTRGIVAAVTNFLAEHYGFIIESAQHGDASTNTFFMRVEFSLESKAPSIEVIRKNFAAGIAKRFGMDWNIADKDRKHRVLVMVSKAGHCLNDLLYRYSTGQLNIDIVAIVANHKDWEKAAKWHEVPFFHWPVDAKTKAKQEEKLLTVIEEENIDLVVLARYMQILSPSLCKKLQGRAINIHHSFLPSFKGAKPYHQAFDRGVKLIGATAHYVTSDLDEGPIIEQEVERVDHTQLPEDLAAIGRDLECRALARAVKYHAEHRVLLNGKKTVVFK